MRSLQRHTFPSCLCGPKPRLGGASRLSLAHAVGQQAALPQQCSPGKQQCAYFPAGRLHADLCLLQQQLPFQHRLPAPAAEPALASGHCPTGSEVSGMHVFRACLRMHCSKHAKPMTVCLAASTTFLKNAF